MTVTASIKDILAGKNVSVEDLQQLRAAAHASEDAWRELRSAAADWGDLYKMTPARRAKCGYALHVLGRTSVAVEELAEAKAEKTAVGAYVLGQCYLALDEVHKAVETFASGLEKEPQNLHLKLGALEARRRAGEGEEVLAEARALAAEHPRSADVLYQVGAALEAIGSYDEAMDTYEDALALEADHAPSLFRLATGHEQRGSEEVALEYYERIAQQTPTYPNALANYGLLLEDLGRYEEAAVAYRRILRARPDHERARLFLKDAEASIDMYYDEDMEKRSSRRNAILRIPVTDFELSVRARNCLNKMNIRNLGDLVVKTEEELLAYKNFGETSLHEIKQMLAQKGLRLGMYREDGEEEAEGAEAAESPADEEVLKKPVTELELSVRARNCMERLSIRTVGELVQKGEAELLAVKNFGQTSLNEVKQRLAEHGLTLKA